MCFKAHTLCASSLTPCCPLPPFPFPMRTKVEVLSFPVSPSGDDGEFAASVLAHRDIAESGLQHCFIQVCPVSVGGVYQLAASGSLDFRNPYGYLPGADYGCLPFELFRVVASIGLAVIFGFAMYRHRSSVLTVHKMILGVMVLATLEAATWWAAYSYMNRTGKPYCCPYPATVVLAMTMEILRRTTSRFMLLMICLGYGITRISLEKREMTSVVALTAAFLGSGILQLASSVASASSLGKYAESENYNPLLAVPALLFDVVGGEMEMKPAH